MPGRKSIHSEAWWASAPPTTLRCTAHLKSDDSQCRQEASAGTNVCRNHGALIPAVQQKAATRIQMSVDEASKKLIEWLSDPAVEMRERIKIAHDLLDRGGLAATSKVLLGVVTEDRVEKLFRDILAQPGALTEPVPDVIDADIVEEAESPSEASPAQPTTNVLEGREKPAEEPTHTVYVCESMSSAPPKRMRADLERAEQLRSLL